ncbi:MAG: hypothetical protein QOJ62_241, partial [Actinomycetota bacterium]|nr:hypothetical protein [Actinomycetota bacterium]
PNTAWGTRTQTIQVLGHNQNSTAFTEIKPAAVYTFAQGNNVVTIPVSATVSAVELNITTNSGAGGGQVAEFQVIGVPGTNPDLTVSAVTASPSAPVETDAITMSATVQNIGNASSAATNVNFYLGSTKVGTASVGGLAAGAQVTVSANIGTQPFGTYQMTAKVDEANTVIEQNETNNSFTNPTSLVVRQISSSDLVASGVGWSPGNPSAGNTVTFTAAIKNQGTIDSGSASHSITMTITDATTNAVVKTLTGSVSGVIASGATSAAVTLGTWTAVNGKYNVTTVIGVDSNEASVKQANNTSTQAFFVGRGANMPYDMYEAEAGGVGGGATVLSPNRTIGDLAGEASGRQAVTLNSTGSYVQWTTRASTNTLVTRFSIPDAAGGGGATASLNIYVNGTLLKPITLTSKYAWLYNSETSPDNNPNAGTQRHIYDEASIMLGTTVPAGSVIKLQKDAANTSQYAIDFVQLEQATVIANPDPAHYLVPASTSQQDVQTAIQNAESSSTALGVYLPAGTYPVSTKFQVSGKAIKVVGAGPWFTQFQTDQNQTNTETGFTVQASANGSTFSGFAIFGNYTSRLDGAGQTFGITDVSNIGLDNIWIEHMVVGVWGTHVVNSSFTNLRLRDTFADGINLNNGSSGNVMNNDEARSTGDDSFALFAAQDHNSSDLTNNTISNVTSLLTWRAAGVAIYGGEANTAKNFLVADTLTYSGLTISSLNFGYPFQGFGTQPTVFTDFSLVRDGGHFWNGQVFPAIWLFSATQPFQGIRVTNAVITDPTYSGIMFQTDYVGGNALNPITDTIFTNTTITGALQSGDAYNAKSGYGIWANQMPEAGQGPAVGSATFNGLIETNNFINIQNTTSTFTITVNP